jgi:DeoR/GlpR family transcriptional regulator of sugar metabolism
VLAEQRQSLILAMVNQRGSVSITEMQRKLRVSRETIRRDLVLLADRNALRKTHGGALSLERSEPEIALREITNAEVKRAIGRRAAGLVPDGGSVILASGSTVQAVADALIGRQGLTVFTNSIVVCRKLAGRNKNRVHVLGGELQAINGATLGRDTTSMLEHYFADFVFVGAGAISPTGWLMDYTREEGELHSLMLQSARTAVVVADHSKFNRYAPVRVENFDKVTHLVTDRAPDAPLAAALSALPLEILVQDTRSH